MESFHSNRFYILEYPEEYIYNYPNFLVNKLYQNINNHRSQSLNLWLENNPPTERKSYVRRFFIENQVTSQEIIVAGW